MHSWRVDGIRYGPRMGCCRILQCRLCGMLWDTGWRRRVPICWAASRRAPPRWERWWEDFKRQAAADGLERAKVRLARSQEQNQANGRQTACNPAPQAPAMRWRWPGLDCRRLVARFG